MSEITEGEACESDPAPIAFRGARAGRFDQVSIALHWLTVLLVTGQFATAWLMGQGGPYAAQLFLVHRSEGVAIWGVVALRLLWRGAFADLPPFPSGMPAAQQWAAKINEYALYALLLLQPVTGLGGLILRGRPVVLFLWRIPSLFVANKPLAHTVLGVHETGALILLGLIGLHAAAGLFHLIVRRDGVFGRMLPWTRA